MCVGILNCFSFRGSSESSKLVLSGHMQASTVLSVNFAV